jgi:hypothetical protein
MFACKIEYIHSQKILLDEDGTVDLCKSLKPATVCN